MANASPLQLQCVSIEEENGFRLQLLIQKATEVLRLKFHQHFSNDPSTLYQELYVHQRLLGRYLLTENNLQRPIFLTVSSQWSYRFGLL